MTRNGKYQLRYVFGNPTAGEFSKEDADAGPFFGLTDSLLLFSIIHPPDGSWSCQFWGWDGRRKPLPDGIANSLDDDELWKVWAMLASRLAASKTLDAGRRGFALATLDALREAVLRDR